LVVVIVSVLLTTDVFPTASSAYTVILYSVFSSKPESVAELIVDVLYAKPFT